MSANEIFQSSKTQERAIEYLEEVRWRGRVICPYCNSGSTCRHVSGDRAGQRWQCQDCTRAFSVTVGTVFHGTHIPLQNWFLIIERMLNAKKLANACQIARDLRMRRPTVWSMMHRIRIAMADDAAQSELLHRIVEAGKSNVGDKPRKGNRRVADKRGERGRDTAKVAVLDVVECGGSDMARPKKRGKLSQRRFAEFIERFVDAAASFFCTEEFSVLWLICIRMKCVTGDLTRTHANGDICVSRVEDFGILVKHVWCGQHHYHVGKSTPPCTSEAFCKYNKQNETNAFNGMFATMVRS